MQLEEGGWLEEGGKPNILSASSSFSSSSEDNVDITGTYPPSPGAAFLRAPSYRAHPTTGAAIFTDAACSAVQPLRGQFSMRGELMHAFICYRLATEGPMGNGLASHISEKIREVSTESAEAKP